MNAGRMKVKSSLFLFKHYDMKPYGGVEAKLHAFLTSALYEDEWSASRLGHFNPEERSSGTHWVRGCVGLRAGLRGGEE
jgi:hypothetical protein